MKFSVLFAVGANCVRPRAFTERPYEDDFLSVGIICFMEGTASAPFLFGASNGNLNPAEQARHQVAPHVRISSFGRQPEAVSRGHHSLQRERVPFGTLSLWSE